MALVGGLLRLAEGFAEQAADRPGSLAAAAPGEREALVAAATGVVGEPRHEEAEDREDDAEGDDAGDQHGRLIPGRRGGQPSRSGWGRAPPGSREPCSTGSPRRSVTATSAT